MITIKKEKFIKVICLAIIILYPLINSFLGIEMGDSGLHYFTFTHLFSNPELIGYSSFFTSLIGWIWYQIFGFLELWGFNLLEVFLEWSMAYITYKFLKNYLDEIICLIGISIAIIATGCYLNIFNYHQFSVFLIEIALILVYKHLIDKKNDCITFCIGIIIGLAILARTSSISLLIFILGLYFMWYLFDDCSIKFLLVSYTGIILGAIISITVLIMILYFSNDLSFFIDNMFKLKNMTSDATNVYSTSNIIKNFIFGNLKTILSGIILFFASILFSLTTVYFKTTSRSIKYKVFKLCIFIIMSFISIYFAYISYNINPVGNSPQFTTGPNFFSGIFYFIMLISFCYTLYFKKSKKLLMLYVIATALPLLTVAGSNTVTKHIIISMWLIAPLSLNSIVQLYKSSLDKPKIMQKNTYINNNFSTFIKIAICFCVVCSSLKFADLVYRTNNFDSLNKFEQRYSINSNNVKFLKTTERQSSAVNEVITCVNKFDSDDKLIVFGQGILLYSILDKEPYIKPWITGDSYSVEMFKKDLEIAQQNNSKNPIIIFCRTNQYFGYQSENYDYLISLEKQTNISKKEVLLEFLKNHNYKMNLLNDYYIVLSTNELDINYSYEDYYHYFINVN
ncbi:hypothetical protein [Clostridium sp. AUH-JLR23]|uniref:hypothetical protein n=1 Tax=Clostridium sp. AUH-JLR23 TaxID=1505062 RepID=UPI003566AB88